MAIKQWIFALLVTAAACVVGLFGFSNAAFAEMLIAKANASKPAAEPFGVFYLSRGYSKGFTADPNKISVFPFKASLIYTSRAYNNAIYSYPYPGGDVVATAPEIIYVDRGYGQAIYSYGDFAGRVYILLPPSPSGTDLNSH